MAPTDGRFRNIAKDRAADPAAGPDAAAALAAAAAHLPGDAPADHRDALAKVRDALAARDPGDGDTDGDDGDDPADPAEGRRLVGSVDEALDRAAAEYPGRLARAFNSKSDAAGYPYLWPDRVYEGLKFLATTYRDAKTGAAPCRDLRAACKQASKLEYSSNQSNTTKGQFAEDYETTWRGKTVPLDAHIGHGNNRDPRYSVRIAFHYDQEEKKVVLGYLGQHQRTRAT